MTTATTEGHCPRCTQPIAPAQARCRDCGLLRREFQQFLTKSGAPADGAGHAALDETDFELRLPNAGTPRPRVALGREDDSRHARRGRSDAAAATTDDRIRSQVANSTAGEASNSVRPSPVAPAKRPSPDRSNPDRDEERFDLDDPAPVVRQPPSTKPNDSTHREPLSGDSAATTVTIPAGRAEVSCGRCGTTNQIPVALSGVGVRCMNCGERLSTGEEKESSTPAGDPDHPAVRRHTTDVTSGKAAAERSTRLRRLTDKAKSGKAQPPRQLGKRLKKAELKAFCAAVAADVETPEANDALATAINAVRESGDARVFARLLERADELNGAPRTAAFRALGRLGGSGAFDALADELAGGHAERMTSAIAGFADLDDARAALPMVAAGSFWPELAEPAVDAIAAFGPRSVGTLLSLIERKQMSSLHAVSVDALGRIGNGHALEGLASLIWHDRRPEMRRRAVEAVALSEDGGAAETLAGALKDADERVRETASEAIVGRADRRLVPKLLPALADGSPVVRRNVVRGLGDTGVREVVKPVSRLFDDPVAAVRVAAREAACLLGDTTAVPAICDELLTASSEGDSELLRDCVASLGRLRDDRAILPLFNAFEVADPQTAAAILRAVGEIGDPSVLPALADAVQSHPATVVRTAAVSALGRLGVSEAVTPLRKAAAAGPPLTVAALRALGNTPHEDAVEELAGHLSDSQAAVRLAAAESLGKIGDKTVVGRLRRLLDDPNDPVAKAARTSLIALGAPPGDAPAVAPPMKRRKAKVPKIRKPRKMKAPSGLPSFDSLTSISVDDLKSVLAGNATVVGGLAAALLLGYVGWSHAGTLGDLASGKNTDIVVRGVVEDVSLSGDGTRVAVARSRGVLDVFTADGDYLLDQKAKAGGAVAMSDDGSRALVGAGNGGQLWDVSETRATDLTGFVDVATNPARTIAVCRDNSGAVHRIDMKAGTADELFRAETKPAVTAMAVNPDGTQVLIGREDGAIDIWVEETGIVGNLFGPRSGIGALAYTETAGHLAAGGRSGRVQVFEKGNGKPIAEVQLDGTRPVTSMQYVSETELVAVCGRSVYWVDAAAGEVVGTMELTSPATTFASFSSSAARLAVAGEESDFVDVYDLTTKAKIGSAPIE